MDRSFVKSLLPILMFLLLTNASEDDESDKIKLTKNNESLSCCSSESALVISIMKNYTKQARPVLDPAKPVVVEIGMRLFGIRDFIENKNTLVLDGYLDVTWVDEVVRWKDRDFCSCCDKLVFETKTLWLPDLKLMTATVAGSSNMPTASEKTLAYSNGTMVYDAVGEFDVKCELDVTEFPFDEQYCELVVESWTYPSSMQSLTLQTPEFIKIDHFWTENELWEIYGNRTQMVHTRYDTDGTVYDRLSFGLFLRRKTLYYYIHVIIPSLIIGVAEIVAFLLPIEEFLKVHISFTCLLAYSVFEDMIIGEMPKSSKTVPLLSLYIDLQMAYIGVLGLMGEGVVCIILRQSVARQKGPPAWMLTFFTKVGVIIFCECNSQPIKYDVTSSHLTSNQPISMPSERHIKRNGNNLDVQALEVTPSTHNGGTGGHSIEIEHLQANNNHRSSFRQNPSSSSSHSHSLPINISLNDAVHREQWIYIAEVCERVNMLLYIAAITITPTVMFFVKGMPYYTRGGNINQ